MSLEETAIAKGIRRVTGLTGEAAQKAREQALILAGEITSVESNVNQLRQFSTITWKEVLEIDRQIASFR